MRSKSARRAAGPWRPGSWDRLSQALPVGINRPCPSQPRSVSRVAFQWRSPLERALTQGAHIVSNLSRSKRGSALPCPRCQTLMDEVVSIAPIAGDPGLTAYECPKGRYVTSVLQQPEMVVSISESSAVRCRWFQLAPLEDSTVVERGHIPPRMRAAARAPVPPRR